MALRARLTLLYTSLFAGSTLVVLAIAFTLFAGHLQDTLPDDLASPLTSRLGLQLALALAGTTLLAIAIGRVVAGRALRPLERVTATARRVSEDRLDERLALDGPHDEVRELADTFDTMLDRLSASLDAQRRFVANAGHELRTPLTVIRAEAEVALDDPDADVAALRAMGGRVIDEVDAMNGLIDALLVLARGQAGLQHREPVDLAAVVRREVDPSADRAATATAIGAEGPTPGDRNTAAQADHEGDPAPGGRAQADPDGSPAGVPVIVTGDRAMTAGDATLLTQMVRNLVDNARRYNRPGGRVDVDVRATPGTVTLRVRNPGPTIAPEDLERLTRPFERLGRHGSGSGLGLSIVQAVVDAHDGALSLTGGPEGGLDVLVTLPAEA
ncbi:MAG: HAMP domain-containing histidine kinase [Solirubrobacteraceae bacterium]|nr:HAMP domain-containing histidine kinase [Solirubrobacteraceae bacterium]